VKSVKKLLALAFCVFFIPPVFSQSRLFNDIFPALDAGQRAKVFSKEGLLVTGKTKLLQLTPASTMDISTLILKRNPSYITESLLVIPYDKTISILDIYNALSNIRGLKGRLYHSATRNENIPLFEDATRIESAKKTAALADPPPAVSVPASEIIYIKLKDANFGNCYYYANIAANRQALLYTLSNFKSLTYMLIPVIKEEKFVAQFYFEPIAEGVLMYSVAGADVSDFVAKQTDMGSAIRKRLEVIGQWVVDGMRQ
jgi:hypothetical protein